MLKFANNIAQFGKIYCSKVYSTVNLCWNVTNSWHQKCRMV